MTEQPVAPPAHVLASHLDDETVLLDLEAKRYFRLNDTASHVWRGLEAGLRGDALVAHVCTAFDVAPEVARAEVDRLVAELRAAGLWPSSEG